MTDTYKNYGELKVHEEIEKDYKISISNIGSKTTIIAPHGGKIEPQTSDIAKHIATEKYNYYCFEGIKTEDNGCLHLTSHNFDEPNAVKLISDSDIVVAIHACTGNSGTVYLGGTDQILKNSIADELETKGINISKDHPRFKGLNPNNICNQGKRKKGVQLEISRDLRDDREKIGLISEAVQAALVKIESAQEIMTTK